MPISFSTLIGFVFGTLVVMWGASKASSDPKIYLDYGAFLIVVGGTLASSFIGFRARYILRALKAIPLIFIRQRISPESLQDDIRKVLEWNRKVQLGGAKALDELASDPKEPHFARYLFGLVGTGYKDDELRVFGSTHIEEGYFRNLSQPNILAYMAAAAPAFGMLGTLIGMVAMLSKLDDPTKVGPGLALAMLATLYGVIFARFIFLPASTKVKQLLGIQRFREYLLLEGVELILQKKSALYIQDRLNSFMDPQKFVDISGEKSGKGK